VEAIIYQYRTGVPWRELRAEFGPWQTVWKRHRPFSIDDSWNNLTVTKVPIY